MGCGCNDSSESHREEIVQLSYQQVGQPKKYGKLPFPHLIEFNESDIGKPYHTFEGVDYDKIPKYIHNRDFKNCYEEYTRCTRLTLYTNPVCGYHTYQNELQRFYSLCELDLSSCKEMKRKGIHLHGTTYRQRGVYFMGEGNSCEIFVRRIAEGLVPRDIRDPPLDDSKPIITITNKSDVLTRAKDLQQDKTPLNFVPNSEYDYENIIY